ncbi:hypothetical protein AQUCO_00800229v1 [Aquilegia coerulea]|uniref:Uncharacterized protein n=1 Tax=Aquilegia coerulea TaxID=218851 RepID=A0A2G5EIC2_AQUCA|nr:hypothetical protein AQUCO_00800229v1 [Aquilegia coerulea]
MDAVSSGVNQTTRNQFPRGNDNEVIKIENAKLWFIGGHEMNRVSGIVKEGDFSIRMVIQTLSPALMTKCIVGDIQWPLTKDSPVLRVGARSFAFAMPGLLYGLQLSPNCHDEIFEMLESIFMTFACYQDVRMIFGSEDYPYFWPLSQWAIECLTQQFLKSVGTYWKRDENHFFNMKERVLRVQQMSFVVKLITKGLLTGKIDPTEHVEVKGKKQPQEVGDDDDDDIDLQASPTIFLFSDLVEALEESKVIMKGEYHLVAPYKPRWIPIPDIAFWNVNKKGLLMMLTTIKSAVYIDFEVPIRELLMPAVKMVEPGENAPTVAVVQEENKPQREIRFPILNNVAETSNQQSNNSFVEQPWVGLCSFGNAEVEAEARTYIAK